MTKSLFLYVGHGVLLFCSVLLYLLFCGVLWCLGVATSATVGSVFV